MKQESGALYREELMEIVENSIKFEEIFRRNLLERINLIKYLTEYYESAIVEM